MTAQAGSKMPFGHFVFLIDSSEIRSSNDSIGQLIACGGFIKCIILYQGNAMRQIDLFKTSNSVKGVLSDGRNALVYRHPYKALGDVGGIGFVAACSENVAKPRNFRILEGCTDKGYSDLCQLITAGKSAQSDHQIVRIGIGDDYLGQAVALECISTDVDQALRHRKHAFNARVGKGVIVDALQVRGCGNGDLFQSTATVKSKFRNFLDGIGQSDLGQIATSVERAFIHTAQLTSRCKSHTTKILAHCKGVIVNGDNACGNVHLRDLRIIECAITERQDIGIGREHDTRQLAVLKSTESDDLHALGDCQRAFPACRTYDQLSAVLGEQQAVLGTVDKVGSIHRNALQIRQCDKGVLTDIGHVCRDMQRGKPRVIKRVAHNHKLSCAAKRNGLELHSLTECTCPDLIDRIGQTQRHKIRIGEGFFGNLGQANASFKGQRRYAAVLKGCATHRFQACGKRNTPQTLGVLKCRAFDHAKRCSCLKRQRLQRRIGKGGASDKLHACRNGYRQKSGSVKGFSLNRDQRIRQNDTLHRRILKC